MDASVYTLLIVESPTIADIVQRICPPSVYVLSTDGYCWWPKYDLSENKIKAIANPEKRNIRRELKEQSKIANTIVLAVDSDPSGDFIAWSVNNFIKSSNVKRGQLQSLSRESIHNMLSDTKELDEPQLEIRLKNRFLIQELWSEYAETPDLRFAGLISVFGANHQYSSFLDENGHLYFSSSEIQCQIDEWISVREQKDVHQFKTVNPLSTFDILEFLMGHKKVVSGHEGQLLLNQLFQTVLPFSDDSLISYPRTSSRAFYGETWTYLKNQFRKYHSVNELKPIYLQEIADSESPHESVHPIDLSLTPESVQGELSKNIGQLYEWIYHQTIQSLSMPQSIQKALKSDLNPDVLFYPQDSNSLHQPQTIRPCITLSELGTQLDELGVIKPSNFGLNIDEFLKKGWIRLEGRVVSPGKSLLQKIDQAQGIKNRLLELNRLKEKSLLMPETVKDVITST